MASLWRSIIALVALVRAFACTASTPFRAVAQRLACSWACVSSWATADDQASVRCAKSARAASIAERKAAMAWPASSRWRVVLASTSCVRCASSVSSASVEAACASSESSSRLFWASRSAIPFWTRSSRSLTSVRSSVALTASPSSAPSAWERAPSTSASVRSSRATRLRRWAQASSPSSVTRSASSSASPTIWSMSFMASSAASASSRERVTPSSSSCSIRLDMGDLPFGPFRTSWVLPKCSAAAKYVGEPSHLARGRTVTPSATPAPHFPSRRPPGGAIDAQGGEACSQRPAGAPGSESLP